jgi:deoxycytidylate deaminase
MVTTLIIVRHKMNIVWPWPLLLVITNQDGNVLAISTNDVTHFGGTTYFDSLEGPLREDNREKTGERDYGKAKLESFKEKLGDCYKKLDETKREWLDNLIEFVRATHAEEQAITTAARLGIPIKDSIEDTEKVRVSV